MKKTKESIFRKKWRIIKKYFLFGPSFLIVSMGLLAGIRAIKSIIETLFWNIGTPYPPKHNRNIWINTIALRNGGFGLRNINVNQQTVNKTGVKI